MLNVLVINIPFIQPHYLTSYLQDTPEQKAVLEDPLSICTEIFLVRESCRSEPSEWILSLHRTPGPALRTSAVTEQLAVSKELQGHRSWAGGRKVAQQGMLQFPPG